MSYNPTRHGQQSKHTARQRFVDPKAGKRHSDIARALGPRGANIEDIRNRQTTPHGWRIPYFEGDEFEMYYEYLCARNGTGVVKSVEHDRCIRILVGTVFYTSDGQINQLHTGQAAVFPKGTEYELSTSGDTDAELLICQGAKYEESLEHITQSMKNNPLMTQVPKEAPSRDSRVDPDKGKKQAQMIAAARTKRRQPVPKKTVINELGEEVPAPHGKVPLPGQAVIGMNPKPVGAGGYSS